MPKTELRLKPHHTRPGEQTIEVWYDKQLLATIVAAEGPRIRILSHDHELTTSRGNADFVGHHLYHLYVDIGS